jgi:hypothetical protein
MAKIITDCPICKHDFMYDPTWDNYLRVDLNNVGEIYSDYPVKDDTWASRRWNKEKTDYVDLSGGIIICQECHEKRCSTDDVNVDGHIVCAKKGCANDANEFSKYCHGCYDEAYPPLHIQQNNNQSI